MSALAATDIDQNKSTEEGNQREMIDIASVLLNGAVDAKSV